MNRADVDSYLRDGCGRCAHYRTPACKVLRWTPALVALREVVRAAGLVEEMKWGSPCYTLDGKNVVMITSFKEHCALAFFKGALLDDPDGVLRSAGPNSRSARSLTYATVDDALGRVEQAARYVAQAVAVERTGARVARPAGEPPLPAELERRLADDPDLREAYWALTPGRRRSHVLHITGAKQSETRVRRVERCAQDIRAGRGFNERTP